MQILTISFKFNSFLNFDNFLKMITNFRPFFLLLQVIFSKTLIYLIHNVSL